MAARDITRSPGEAVHRGAGTGETFWGSGDVYTFLVTGEETGGAYAAVEALVEPGGGPPSHVHRDEDETFYVLEGHCTFVLGEQTITAGPGDFVNVPRGTAHCFRNGSSELVRLILTFTPAGIESFFRGTLKRGLVPAA
jgi:quercetin dioxygenase-like cupin family protein